MSNPVEPAPSGRMRPADFCWDIVVFKVEEAIFRVNRHGFIESSAVFETMFLLPHGNGDHKNRGRTEETAIVLEGYKATDFDALLRVLYPSYRDLVTGGVSLTKDQWAAVLKLSTVWEMKEIREFAMKKLSDILPTLSPVELVTLARNHKVSSWLVGGLTALTLDGEVSPDSLEEAVGLRAAFRILAIRLKLSPSAKSIAVGVASEVRTSLPKDDSDLVSTAEELVLEVFQDEVEEYGGSTDTGDLRSIYPLRPRAPVKPTPAAIITQELPVPMHSVRAGGIIGFGQDGVVILGNCASPDTRLVIAQYSYNNGWRVDQHVRLVGDTTGNGHSDIIAFGPGGVSILRNNGNKNFGGPTLAINDFGTSAGGWTNTNHIRYVADLRKKGMVDLVGFGNKGIMVSLNNGDGTYAPSKLVLNEFGYGAGGWRLEKHLRFLADTTGDGLPDVVGFGESAVVVATNRGDGTFNPGKSVVHNFAYGAGGWRIEKHPRTVADLTGDGRVDIVGFGEAGVYVSFNNGDGTFQAPKLVLNQFGYAQGWWVKGSPRFIVDINRNGCGDIVGFDSVGVLIARNKGDGTFETPEIVVAGFGKYLGWRVDKHPRFLVDLNGNGCPDIIGFGEYDVWVSYNDGAGNFASVVKLTNSFAYNGGQWAVDKTVRWVANL